MPGGVAVTANEGQTFIWSTGMVGWLLWNYSVIAEMYKRIEPSITSKYVNIPLILGFANGECKVVKVAIERVAISSILDAVDGAVLSMPAEYRKVYRLKYRAGMANKDIQKKLNISRRTLDRRIQAIKGTVAAELAMVPEDMSREFWKKIDEWR